MRIIFSKDRPAQLDLLLRSLDRYAHDEGTVVINSYTTDAFWNGYIDIEYGRTDRLVLFQADDADLDFDGLLRRELQRAGETVTFFCDDDVVFRPIPDDPRRSLDDSMVLAHSWRLAYPDHQWLWPGLPRTDLGYPGSIDGHTFRTSDIKEMIGDEWISGPTMLETIIALGCERFEQSRPLMAAWPEQVLVGVPVNRVSETSGCPNGERFPQPVEELNRRFLAGERIALDRLDFSGVDGCHHEIQYEWE